MASGQLSSFQYGRHCDPKSFCHSRYPVTVSMGLSIGDPGCYLMHLWPVATNDIISENMMIILENWVPPIFSVHSPLAHGQKTTTGEWCHHKYITSMTYRTGRVIKFKTTSLQLARSSLPWECIGMSYSTIERLYMVIWCYNIYICIYMQPPVMKKANLATPSCIHVTSSITLRHLFWPGRQGIPSGDGNPRGLLAKHKLKMEDYKTS